MRVLVMAGGTGGHIFPALAVAKKLIQQGHEVHWLGTKNGMEADVAKANAIPLHSITISGVRGKNITTKILAPLWISVAVLQSLGVMLAFRPDVVLGMGGYVTGPAGLAAWLTRRKLVIHEQNAIAGMTNKILAKFSYRVLEAFPQSFPAKVKANLTGNPVREDFHKLLAPEKRSKSSNPALKILVLGGSGGAQALNNILPAVLKNWGDLPELIIWHQAGAKHLQNAQAAYQAAGVSIDAVKLVPFIQDMPNAYAWADLVICRAGALTIAELAAAGVASILIPYPFAVDDHQTKNAQYLVQAGAALLMPEHELSIDKLLTQLRNLAQNPAKLQVMAKAAHSMAQPEALDKVVGFLN